MTSSMAGKYEINRTEYNIITVEYCKYKNLNSEFDSFVVKMEKKW